MRRGLFFLSPATPVRPASIEREPEEPEPECLRTHACRCEECEEDFQQQTDQPTL